MNNTKLIPKETILRKMVTECEKRNGINLTHGIIDTDPPSMLLEAAQRAIRDGKNSYTPLFGTKQLRDAISWKLIQHNHVEFNPDDEIIVTAGAAGAFFCTIMGLLNSGDEILVFEPYYPYHVNVLSYLGIIPSYINLIPPDWRVDAEMLKSKINERTKAILINTPSNPIGKVFSHDELEMIANIAIQYDLIVITDEVYEYFVYENAKHMSPASLPELKNRTVTISSFSKTFSITGWRIGYIACNKMWAKNLAYLNEHMYFCAPSPLQIGVATAIQSLSNAYYAELSAYFLKNLTQISNSLRKANLTPIVPNGSFYILANLSRLPGDNGLNKALYLLDHTSVGCVPCAAFSAEGSKTYDDYARFSFGVTNEKLGMACDMIENMS